MKNRLLASLLLFLSIISGHGKEETRPLTLNEKTGHYEDLSYTALSDKNLSWEQCASLFGGETSHFLKLNKNDYKKKQQELQNLLRRIEIRETQNWADPKLLQRTENEIITWLNAQIEIQTSAPSYSGEHIQSIRNASVGFFRAYEIFNKKPYLDAGLKCADKILAAQ